MNRAMIDIETLSHRPDGCIISVGVAIFDDKSVLQAESWAIDSRCWHGHIDPGTIKWWMKQEKLAQDYSFSGTETDIAVALALQKYVMDYKCEEIYANDPNFDLVMLEAWWSRLHIEWPFKFWNYRSFRTITKLTEELTGINFRAKQGKFVAHNPMEDAVAQARVVIECRQALLELRQ